MQFISDRKIKLDKPLNDLDKLVIRFIRILGKYTEYVLISGYVAILFGRSRGTEDVDIFILPIDVERFVRLYHDLKANGFWCLNAESDDEVYNYLHDGFAVRFAENGQVIPNFEVKFALKDRDKDAFTDCLEVETEGGVLNVSSIEKQIAFKRYVLKSDKDLEDAQHLEEIFRNHLNTEKIKIYQRLLEREYGTA